MRGPTSFWWVFVMTLYFLRSIEKTAKFLSLFSIIFLSVGHTFNFFKCYLFLHISRGGWSLPSLGCCPVLPFVTFFFDNVF